MKKTWAAIGVLAVGMSGRGVAQDAPERVDFSADKFKEMLAADKALVAQDPGNPKSYVNTAYTLADVGAIAMAKEWTGKALALNPKMGSLYSAKGWVLRHNEIGLEYGKGFDYDGMVAAYKAGIEADPNNFLLRRSYVDALERSRDGVRYAPDANLGEAIAQLLSMKNSGVKGMPADYEDNLLIDLFYAGRFKEVKAEMIPEARPVRDGVLIAAVAAEDGGAAGVAEADKLGDPARRREALHVAAEGLWNMRMYGLAADMLGASSAGSGRESVEAKQEALFRTLKPYKVGLAETDPRAPVERLLFALISERFDEKVAAETVSRHAFSSEASWKKFIGQGSQFGGLVRELEKKTDLPLVVIRDIMMTQIRMEAQPAGAASFRVTAGIADGSAIQFFVVKEDGAYRIVGQAGDTATVGNEVLYLLGQGREEEAGALLDWRRTQVRKEEGGDPLGGALVGMFWPGEDRSAGSMETAADALVVNDAAGTGERTRLEKVAAKIDGKDDPEGKADMELLLAEIAVHAGDGVGAKKLADGLVARYPASKVAVRVAGEADGLVKDWAGWNAMLDARLAKAPGDRFLVRQKALEAEREGDYGRARKVLKGLVDGGGAGVEEYDAFARLSVLSGEVDAAAAEAADKAVGLAEKDGYHAAVTLAYVDAALGKTGEARELLLKAMEMAHVGEPNSDVWLGFGLIDEQYGLKETAAAAYRRVEKADGADGYALAQRRLAAL